MGAYSVNVYDKDNTVSTTLVSLKGGTGVRAKVYDLLIGAKLDGANAAIYTLRRTDAPGTGTTLTPVAYDPGDPTTPEVTAIEPTFSVEPTYGTLRPLFGIALNQRATFRWYAVEGREIILPLVTDNGVGLFVSATQTTFRVNVTLAWTE